MQTAEWIERRRARGRRWLVRISVVAALGAAASHASGAGAQAPGTFGAKLDEILARPDYRRSEFGVALYDLDSSRLVFEHNAGKFFTPGSTTKLLSVGTALAYLGSDFRFHTSVYRTGPVRGGRLTGDLILVASGDPNLSGRIQPGDTLAFTNEDHSYGGGSPFTTAVPGDPLLVIRKLASQVAAIGIRRIDGRVLVDATMFTGVGRDADATSAVSPIVVNDNVVDVTVEPGASQGAKATVTVSPDLGYVRVMNEVTTGAPGTRPSMTRLSDVTNADGTHTVRLAGSAPVGSAAVLYAYSVSDPRRFAEMALAMALAEKGVTIAARTNVAAPDFQKLSASYTDANRVAEHVSPAFAEVAKATLKVSQNLHASMMPYLVGALIGKKTGRDLPQAGFDLERELLMKGGLEVLDASQGDGAGGAPGAFYTPEFMVRYLAYMATRREFAAFKRALPVLGKDGTLWNIQPNAPAAGKVFAKTGTFQVPDPLNRRTIVTGKGLAGYLTTSSGRRLAICLYANRVPRPSDAEGGAALLVGQVLGEIADAAWGLPIERRQVVDDGTTPSVAWRDPAPHRVRMIRVAPNVSVEVLDFGGTGEPILFLHGYGNTAHSFDDFAPRLTDQYRVFAMTRRGNGASSRPDTGYSITTLATDIRTVLDSLGITRVHLAGHSFGGDQITKFALLFPDRLRSLVYLDAAHDRKDLGRGPPGPPRVPPTADDSGSLGGIRAYLARNNGTVWPEAEVHAFYRFGPDGRVLGRSTGGAGPINAEIAKSQEHPDYAHIRAPALAFYALQPRPEQANPMYHALDAKGRALVEQYTDYWYRWALQQRDAFRRGMHDGQVVEIIGGNHFVFVSHELEVLQAMREFFERHRAN